MLVLTSVPALRSEWSYHLSPNAYPSNLLAAQAAYDREVMLARVEAIEKQRQYEARIQAEEAIRRQLLLDTIYQRQPSDRPLPVSHLFPAFEDVQHLPYGYDDRLQQSMAQEYELRRIALARQREQARVEATQRLLEVEQRRQAQIKAQRDMQQVAALLQLLNGSVVEPSAAILKPTARAQAYPRTAAIPSVNVSSPHDLTEHLRTRLSQEQDTEVREALASLLSFVAPPIDAQPMDVKGKGKAKEVFPPSFSSSTDTQSEDNEEIQLNDLLSAFFRTSATPEQSEAGPSSSKSADDTKTAQSSAPASSNAQSTSVGEASNGAPLHRKPAISPAAAEKLLSLFRSRRARKHSLGAVKEIQDTLHALQASFVFPDQLDFAPPATPPHDSDASSISSQSSLAYTPNNTPVHMYEHSLNELLTQLDAVQSEGDLEVRGRRKEVVREVEQALAEVEKRVEESRERMSVVEQPISGQAATEETEAVIDSPLETAAVDAILPPNDEPSVQDSAPSEAAPETVLETSKGSEPDPVLYINTPFVDSSVLPNSDIDSSSPTVTALDALSPSLVRDPNNDVIDTTAADDTSFGAADSATSDSSLITEKPCAQQEALASLESPGDSRPSVLSVSSLTDIVGSTAAEPSVLPSSAPTIAERDDREDDNSVSIRSSVSELTPDTFLLPSSPIPDESRPRHSLTAPSSDIHSDNEMDVIYHSDVIERTSSDGDDWSEVEA